MENELVKIENNEIIVANEVVQQIIEFQKAKAKMDLMEKELKASLKDAMDKKGIKKFIVNGLCASIKDSYTRSSLDSKKLKEDYPDIYNAYLKESTVASSISLTFEE